jgi:hypothetical protein
VGAVAFATVIVNVVALVPVVGATVTGTTTLPFMPK